MSFLTVVTRVYQRPVMLLECISSLARQTDPDYDQVFLVDEEGRGVQWANGQFYRHRARVTGDYVLMLDDDDHLTRPDAIARLKLAAVGRPDVVMARFDVHGHGPLPDDRFWRRPPAATHISTSSGIVRRDVWQRHIKAFDQPIAGDARFWQDVWAGGATVEWLDIIIGETQRVSRGAPE